jgi:Pyridoxamine 5'-phosphate oxidase
MPSRREQIRLDDAELAAYMQSAKTVIVGSNGPRGVPHLMPLWFVLDGDDVLAWTFAKSQKAKNLGRDPRATLLFEDGTEYQELRGVMLECDVDVLTDFDDVRAIGISLFTKMGGGGEVHESVVGLIEAQTPKRIGMRFRPSRVVSWDHRKLGDGVY